MSTKAFLILLAVVGLLLAGVVYMHVPRAGASRRGSALHGAR